MNRAEFAGVLSAVLPHAGGFVGLQGRDGWLYGYASDRYTVGIARTPNTVPLHVQLATADARDLLRFVKPGRVPERSESVRVVQDQDRALHVAYGESSEVYDALPDLLPPTLDDCADLLNRIREQRWNGAGSTALDPAYLKRFGSMDPLNVTAYSRGAWILQSEHFIGAVQGIARDHAPADFSFTSHPAASEVA